MCRHALLGEKAALAVEGRRQMIVWRLRAVAEAQGKTVGQVAKTTGLAYQTVLSIWRGSAGRVDLKTLAALCAALNVQPGDLLAQQAAAEENDNAGG
jgi:DNA-binding Xre family transcriptional regulator